MLVEDGGKAPAWAPLRDRGIFLPPPPHHETSGHKRPREHWHAALVLPQARWVLETRLRELARDVHDPSFCLLPLLIHVGAAAGSRTRMRSLAESYSCYVITAAEIQRAGSVRTLPARAILTKNKHLLAICAIPTRGFTAAVSVFRGTPPRKPFDCKISC